MTEAKKRTPLLGLTEEDVGDTVVLVLGEEAGKVTDSLKAIGCELIEISRRRESRTIRASRNKTSFPVVLGGYGSASATSTLHELIVLGAKNFIMAGTCGASRHFSPGEIFIISRAVFNPPGAAGGAGYYLHSNPGQEFVPDPELLIISRSLNLETAGSAIISCDTFYGFGGIIDENGQLRYDGPALNEDNVTPGFQAFRDLLNRDDPFLLDMETAFFYALCQAFQGVKGIAIRGISNYVPFNPDDFIPEED